MTKTVDDKLIRALSKAVSEAGSLEALAEMSKLSKATISRIIARKIRVLRSSTWEGLEPLLQKHADPHDLRTQDADKLPVDEVLLLDAYRSLPSDKRREVHRFMRELNDTKGA
jgi:hypothetical protein